MTRASATVPLHENGTTGAELPENLIAIDATLKAASVTAPIIQVAEGSSKGPNASFLGARVKDMHTELDKYISRAAASDGRFVQRGFRSTVSMS